MFQFRPGFRNEDSSFVNTVQLSSTSRRVRQAQVSADCSSKRKPSECVRERTLSLSLSLAILAFNSSKLSWLRNCRWCEWMGRAACVWWRERERKWFLSKSEWKLRERRESCNFNTPLWRQILKNIFIWTFKMTLLVIIVMLWWNFDLKLINYERVAFSILRTSKTLL